MFTTRYKFNQETLTYEKVELTSKQKIFKFSLFGLGFLLAIVLISFTVFSFIFDISGAESALHEKKQLLVQYRELQKELDKVQNDLTELKTRDENIYRIIFEEDPLPTSIREAGFGGTDRYEKFRNNKNSEVIIETTKRLDQLKNKLNIQAQSYHELFNIAKRKAQELACIPAIMPVPSDKTYITSYFGYRFHPILRRKRMHDGIDFAGAIGTNIYATGDGIVKDAGYSGGYGKLITIEHGFGYASRYGHLNKIFVKRGEKVKRGQVIATLGSSGLSSGPHLHYEVQKDDKKVNPLYYYFKDISPEEYNKLISLQN